MLLLVALNGCAVYSLSPSDEPRVIGFGSVKEQSTEKGRLFKVTTLGLGLRSGYLSSGLCLGWYEGLVFCGDDSNGDQGVHCIADYGSSVGLDISGGGFTLGVYRALRIPLPDSGAVVQEIHYSQAKPAETQIEWRELR